MFSDFLFRIRAVCEIMSKNMVEPERSQREWRLRVVYWISKQAKDNTLAPTPVRAHTHTHTQKYVIPIAFPYNIGFLNVPQCYVRRTLPLLFVISTNITNSMLIDQVDCVFVIINNTKFRVRVFRVSSIYFFAFTA
jgi:hypothetical protein